MSAKDEAIKRKMESTIGLSPGKASGKTIRREDCRICPTCRLCQIHGPDEERIAELEAELTEARSDAEFNDDTAVDYNRAWRQALTRAEKAEAEVERLSLLQKKATPRTDYHPIDEVADEISAARKERDDG